MLDSQIHLSGDEVTFSGLDGWISRPHGSGHPALAPYAVFQTADKPIVIAAVGAEKFWLNFISVLGISHLSEDVRFIDNSKRSMHIEELTNIIHKKLKVKVKYVNHKSKKKILKELKEIKKVNKNNIKKNK